MSGKTLLATLSVALLLILPFAGAQDMGLNRYLSEEQYRHMELMGYTTAEQFQALAEIAPDALCEELDIDYYELENILEAMPYTRDFEPVYEEDQPLGLLLEDEPRIVSYEELLEEQPDYVDMSSTDLIPNCPPIRNQGQRGTCASFSGTVFLEYEYMNYEGYNDLDLSEQYFFYACKQRDGSPYSDGTTMTAVRDTVKYDGTCYEDTWPYNPNPTNDPAQGPAPAGAAQEAKSFVYPNVKYWSSNPGISTLKSYIDDGHIISFGTVVYNSWYKSSATKKTGVITMPISGDSVAGGHAMDLVGYVDNTSYAGGGYFLLRNSWGTGWAYQSITGNPGYGVIPYAYITNYWQGGFTAA
jgi:C1A family cysteine protease